MHPTRLFDIISRYAIKYPKPDMLASKVDGKWVTYSSDQVVETVNFISSGFIQMGLQKEDKISIISNNRPEWIMANTGLMQAGGINVPIYPTINDADLEFILKDAEVKYIFVSDAKLYDKVSKHKNNLPDLIEIYTFDKVEGAKHWSEISELGKSVDNKKRLEEIKNSIKTDDLATLIYTSGTTANPKGVMLSHNNILSNAFACHDLAEFKPNQRVLSFLPLNHILERMGCNLYLYMGLSIYFAESIEKVGENLKEVRPHHFITVPRLLEKIYDKVIAKGGELKGIKKLLFFWALNLGLRYELNGLNGWWYELQLTIANKIVFKKWRAALGGNIVLIVSGGAALQPRLARVFNATGIPVMEGYGMTETSPVIAVNNFKPNSIRFGTVGPVIPGVEVKIADDGEILVRGPNIMLGYYKNKEATQEAMRDGWFHTGDVGEFVENRFLKITDRKKEIFKTSGGKYISPIVIENLIVESPFIDQVIVIGENQKFPAALIVPNYQYIKEWCRRKAIEYTTRQEMSKHERVIARIWKEVNKVNQKLSPFEMIKKIEILPSLWTVDEGELTPKLNLKRKVIAEKNKVLIEKIYS